MLFIAGPRKQKPNQIKMHYKQFVYREIWRVVAAQRKNCKQCILNLFDFFPCFMYIYLWVI